MTDRPPRRLIGLSIALLLALAAFAGQKIWLDQITPIYSQDYWLTLTPEQLEYDLSQGRITVDATGIQSTNVMHWAASWASDARLIEILLEHQAELTKTDPTSGRQPIHLAAFNPHLEIIESLVAAGADVNLPDQQGLTPLHLAAAANPNVESVERLIALGADPNAVDQYLNTPLHKAAIVRASDQVLRLLIELGADLQARNYVGHRPVEIAVKSNPQLAVVQFFLRHSVERIDQASDVMGQSFLHLAAGGNSNPELIDFLIELGADPRATDDIELTALHRASGQNPHVGVLNRLIEQGSEISRVNPSSGYSALHYAAAFNSEPAVVRLLLDSGARSDLRTRDQQMNPLHLCLSANNREEVCTLFLDHPELLRQADSNGYTALHYALGFDRSAALIEKLIDGGGDLTAATHDGLTVRAMIDRKRLAAQLGLN